MKLFFQQIHQNAIEADIPSDITIEQLRELLVSQYSFPDKHMKFIVKGKILTDSSNFAEIEENSRIIVYIKKDPIVSKNAETQQPPTVDLINSPQTETAASSDMPKSKESDPTQKEPQGEHVNQTEVSSIISSSLPFNLVSQNPENVTIAPSTVKITTTDTINPNNIIIITNDNNNNNENNDENDDGDKSNAGTQLKEENNSTNPPNFNISCSSISAPTTSHQQQILRHSFAALDNSIVMEPPLIDDQIEGLVGECFKKIRLEQLYNEKYEFYGQLNETRRMADMIDHNPGLRLVLKQFFRQNYTVACKNQEVRIENAFALAGFVTTAPTTLKDEDEATIDMMPQVQQDAIKRLMTIGKTKAETLRTFLEAKCDEKEAETRLTKVDGTPNEPP